MTDSSTLILDFLAILGGGRGPQLNQVAPHLLSAIFWGILSFSFCLLSNGRRNSTDSVLFIGFNVLFVTSLSMTVSSLLLVQEYAQPLPQLVTTIWIFLERFGGISGRILLSAAFLQIVLGRRELTTNYLKLSIGVIALAIISEQSGYWVATKGSDVGTSWPESEHIPLLSQLAITLLFSFALYKSMGSLRRIRLPIVIALTCFLLDSILCVAVLHNEASFGPIVNPIRGHLQLWAVPFVTYVAFRLRHVEGQRRERGIQTNERLEALGQLSSGIAHDFNNNLQIILGYTELAKTNGNLDHDQLLPLTRIEEAAESAGALVNQLLAFSRGKPSKFEPVDLNEIITRITPMLSRLLGPDIRLMHVLDLDTKKVLADVHMIEQIIINLVVNSKDAISGSGTITIELRSLSRHDPNRHTGEVGYERTQLLVSDTGIGMDDQTLRRVFEPFFTTKPVGQGTGLGLSTVYSAVQKQNGAVFIKSKLGKFTRVYIEFPTCDQPVSLHEKTQIRKHLPSARGETILLAEDETAIRNLAGALLQTAGYNVLVARDGQHAINIVGTYKAKIDLCLLDVTMPVMNGYETYDCIAADHIGMPVLFITGNTSRVAHVRSNLPHLQKPFSKYDLFREVRHILDTPVTA